MIACSLLRGVPSLRAGRGCTRRRRLANTARRVRRADSKRLEFLEPIAQMAAFLPGRQFLTGLNGEARDESRDTARPRDCRAVSRRACRAVRSRVAGDD